MMRKRYKMFLLIIAMVSFINFVSCGSQDHDEFNMHGYWILEEALRLDDVIQRGWSIVFSSGNRFDARLSANHFIRTGHTPNATIQRNADFSIESGTFFITDNRIEFNFDDGLIIVREFTRTENTIDISGRYARSTLRFVRR